MTMADTDERTTEDKRLIQRYVSFELPFPLALRNSLPDWDQPPGQEELAPEIYVAGEPPAAVTTRLIIAKGGGTQGIQAFGELEGGDPYGRISFSRVCVRYHIETTPTAEGWDGDQLARAAVTAVNRVITHYRDVAGKWILSPLSVDDVAHFVIVEDYAAHPRHTWFLTKGRGPLRMGLGEEERAREEALRARLQSGQDVPFLRQLHLAALSHFDSGDFRLAVVEQATLFEAWLRRRLVGALRQQGMTEDKIEKKFQDPKGKFLTITTIARDLVPEILGKNFVKSAPGQAWQKKCVFVRNELIHGSREAVSQAEATAALVAADEARKFLAENA